MRISIERMFKDGFSAIFKHIGFFLTVIVFSQAVLLGILALGYIFHPLSALLLVKTYPYQLVIIRGLPFFLPSGLISYSVVLRLALGVLMLLSSGYFGLVLVKMVFDAHVDGKPRLSAFKEVFRYILPTLVGILLMSLIVIPFIIVSVLLFLAIIRVFPEMTIYTARPASLLATTPVLYIVYRFWFFIAYVFSGYGALNALKASWRTTGALKWHGILVATLFYLVATALSLPTVLSVPMGLVKIDPISPVTAFLLINAIALLLYGSLINLLSASFVFAAWRQVREQE